MNSARCSWTFLVLLALLLVGVAVVPAFGQPQPWPMPDGFEFQGVCCQPANPTLPNFPAITQTIKFICWFDCQSRVCANVCVNIGAPRPATINGVVLGCGVYFIPFTIRTCAVNPQTLWSGTMIGTYARTWLEDTVPDPQGIKEAQVWRILLNGDLIPSAFLIQHFGTNPCVIPQCFRSFRNHVYWFGYIDYRNDCRSGQWTVEWALDHECDFFHHNADSGRPAPAGIVFHPQHSFTFVGPNTFTCDPTIPPSQGPIIQQSVRQLVWNGPQPPLCLRNDPLHQGLIQPTQDVCICGGPAAPPVQYALTQISGASQCGIQFGNATGPKPFVQKRIGFFTDAAGNPFKFLLLKEGDLSWADPTCTGLVSTEYFEGTETIGGFPAFELSGMMLPLGRQFDDDGSSNFIRCERRKAIPHVVCKIINANLP